MAIRTDLAMEAKEIWEESADETTQLKGVLARETTHKGIKTAMVKILNAEGEEALQKPIGTYLTIELDALNHRERNAFRRAAEAMGKQLRDLMRLKKDDTILVVGLGNEAVTPDAVGPLALEHLLITRHLVEQMPKYFAEYRSVAGVAPGVLGITGLESAEIVRGVVARAAPDCVIVVDALASRSLARVCTTIQLSDSGITPGSGIKNAREAFNQETLGVPVYAIGVPTVVDMETLLQDFADARYSEGELAELGSSQRMVVTPQDIDAKIGQIAKLVAYGINLALHPAMSVEDIAYFVE